MFHKMHMYLQHTLCLLYVNQEKVYILHWISPTNSRATESFKYLVLLKETTTTDKFKMT